MLGLLLALALHAPPGVHYQGVQGTGAVGTGGSHGNLGLQTTGAGACIVATNCIRVTKLVVPSGITAASMTIWVDWITTGYKFKGVIYTDASGSPSSLVGATNEMTAGAGTAGAWQTLSFASGPTMNAGTYWIGIFTDFGMETLCDTSTGVLDWSDDVFTYPTPPSTIASMATSGAHVLSVYVTY